MNYRCLKSTAQFEQGKTYTGYPLDGYGLAMLLHGVAYSVSPLAFARVADIIVGAFYETPKGVVRVTGSTQTHAQCSFDGGKREHIPLEQACDWVPRPDLKDFPDAIDPLLPYVFDLDHDIKNTSQLAWCLGQERGSDEELRDLMEVHNIPAPIGQYEVRFYTSVEATSYQEAFDKAHQIPRGDCQVEVEYDRYVRKGGPL